MTDYFKKLVTNPLEKLVNDSVNSLINKAESALLGSVGDALGRLGLSSKSRSSFLAGLGDSILSGIASEFFGGFSGEVNRLSKRQIIENTGIGAASGDASTDNISKIPQNDSSIESLHFPSDLGEYYISFQFREYVRTSPTDKALPIGKGDIALPLPKDLVEAHELSYNVGTELGVYGAIMDASVNSNNTISGAFTGAAAYAMDFGASEVGDAFRTTLQQTLGAVANPNISTSFQAPRLRSHKFNWLFAPNNATESQAIKNIIRKFKAAALPTFAQDTTAILQFPLMCQVVLYPWAAKDIAKASGKDFDTYMYVFKTCMIDAVVVNYAPETPVFFGNKAPAFISLGISLLEIDYFTSDDFGGNGTSKKGVETLINAGTKIIDNVTSAVAQILPTDPTADPNAGNPDAETPDGGAPGPTGNPAIQPPGTPGNADIVARTDVIIAGKGVEFIKTRDGQWWQRSDKQSKFVNADVVGWSYAQNALSKVPEFKTAGITLDNKPQPNQKEILDNDGKKKILNQNLFSTTIDSTGKITPVGPATEQPKQTGETS
jgi:hypothetical protein